MKRLLTRFTMPSWKKSASDRIDVQVSAGQKIQQRIEDLRGKDQLLLPRAAWVSGEELDSWQFTGGQLIEELFGAGSTEKKKWDELWTVEPAGSAFDKVPEDRYLNRISQLLAYLNGLKNSPALARNSFERVQDKIARHPILGVFMAVIASLATLFGIARGIAWLLSNLPF